MKMLTRSGRTRKQAPEKASAKQKLFMLVFKKHLILNVKLTQNNPTFKENFSLFSAVLPEMTGKREKITKRFRVKMKEATADGKKCTINLKRKGTRIVKYVRNREKY